jgi:hypothetical protein
MEVNIRVNKDPNTFFAASKIGPFQDGGVPFTFTVFMSEDMINTSNVGLKKAAGFGYFQIGVAYKGSIGSLPFFNNDGRFAHCTITHLGKYFNQNHIHICF